MTKESSSYTASDWYEFLNELAYNLHWSWSHVTDKIWRQLDAELWELTHNPLVVLRTVSKKRITEVLEDHLLQELVKELVEARRTYTLAPAWFQHHHSNTNLSSIAYFSMEYMLSEGLPIYSGGLGNVAGDHLKTASDLGVPLVAVGLLFQQGYPRQVVQQNGEQSYVRPFNDPEQLPVVPLRNAEGEWIRISIELPGYPLWLRTWKVQVGRTMLLLLDSNDAANFPQHRGITGELYVADTATRLQQEMILGIGGYRLLQELGIRPQVCHLNEGHTAFAVLERALQWMNETGVSFHEALAITRGGNIFTTHTAVGGGFDKFESALIDQHLGRYIYEKLKITLQEFLALGRIDAANQLERFDVGLLAIRGCSKMNAVSKLHASVSRQLFAPVFPRWPLAEIPVSHITNGVHMPTWDSAESDRLWTEACGKNRWTEAIQDLETQMLAVSKKRLWEMRQASKIAFVEAVRKRYQKQLAVAGAGERELMMAKNILHPSVLTIGFARRFVAYKRLNLLLTDRRRLARILNNTEHPVQLVIAGKAHTDDQIGRNMLKEWLQFTREYQLHEKVVFLSDYDMLLCAEMVQGVDLWINTPLRPWEACGTSGMKVLVNGGLQLSTLDGWWDEAYDEKFGWAISNHMNAMDQNERDRQDADQLYNLLESEIIPLYYNRDDDGIPLNWVERIRLNMAILCPQYSSNRSMCEYIEKMYIPLAHEYERRSANHGEAGRQLYWQKTHLEKGWETLAFGDLSLRPQDKGTVIAVEVQHAGLSPEEFIVELYFISGDGSSQTRLMQPVDSISGVTRYEGWINASEDATHFTPRILPALRGANLPLECPLILWHH